MFGVFQNKELLYWLITLLIIPADNCACGSKKTETPKNVGRSCAHTCTCARGGVVSNSPLSAGVGRDILAKGGSAVDAAIATLLCEGVMLPHIMGIGGGFLMTLYDANNKVIKTLNARETAPGAATENMFEGQVELSEKGGLSVCVPGEIRGYWCAHQEYGKLPWAELVKPASIFAKYGFKVTSFMEGVFAAEEEQLNADEELKKLYINPKTSKPYQSEQIIKNVKLGKTLEKIAEHGESVLYNGELTNDFVDDIQRKHGIISLEDMNNYEPLWDRPLTTTLPNNHTLYTVNSPGSGAILILMLNILDDCLDLRNINTVDNWHKIIESMKFGYGARTHLGDSRFVPDVETLIENLTSKPYAVNMRDRISENTQSNPDYYGASSYNPNDHGTANIVVFASNGDAVSATSTINHNFGAGFVSESTGIILNNEINDFSLPDAYNMYGLPPSQENFIAPGKRPVSSMAPSILLDKCGNVVLGIGGAGGSKITTEVALVILRHIFFQEPLGEAMSSRRLLHQLIPMHIMTEYGFCEKILKGLMKRGHKLDIAIPDGFAAVTALARKRKSVYGSYDPRRGGQVALQY